MLAGSAHADPTAWLGSFALVHKRCPAVVRLFEVWSFAREGICLVDILSDTYSGERVAFSSNGDEAA